MNAKNYILLFSRDKKAFADLKHIFLLQGMVLKMFSSLSAMEKFLRRKTASLVLFDIDSDLSNAGKLGSLRKSMQRIRKRDEFIPLILTASPPFLSLSLSFISKTATFYIKKPFTFKEIKAHIDFFKSYRKKLHSLQELEQKVENLKNEISSRELIDPLTGSYNYRYFIRRLREELKRAKRHILPLSIALIDIDSFGKINEDYGEKSADLIIVKLAHLLRFKVREDDIICRFGGGRFYLILPETDSESAEKFAVKINEIIRKLRFKVKSKRFKLSVNIGIASYPAEGIRNYSLLVKASNTALEIARQREDRISVYHKSEELKSKEENLSVLKSRLARLNENVNQGLIDMIYGFAKTIEAKDKYTGRHVEDTALFAEKIAKKLNLSKKEIEDIKHAAILHDLGKIGIREEILSKKGSLTAKEREEMQKHPLIAADILKSIHALSGSLPAVLHHHECYDGRGYPYGLKGEEIPLSARIVAIADVYQALISDRPYRKAYSKKKALDIIKKESGTHFDPKIVKSLLAITK